MVFWFIMIIMGTSFFSGEAFAIFINEADLNPSGNDNSNTTIEWVELYSEEQFNLDGYYLETLSGKIRNLSGSFSGYFVFESSRWLRNTNEKVMLKDSSGEVLSETEIIEEETGNDFKGWSKCGSDWIFVELSYGNENLCGSQNNQQSNNQGQQNQQQNNKHYSKKEKFF